jgi:hypothetical protein
MRKPTASNPAGLLAHGRHTAMLLADGLGIRSLADAHDPVPRAADRHAHSFATQPGDPFDDPSRPLVLAIGSDCDSLPRSTRNDLLALSGYPGVALALMPGVDRLGYNEPALISWDVADTHLTIQLTRQSNHRRGPDLFGDATRPDTKFFDSFDPNLPAWAAHVLGVSLDEGRAVVAEVAAHKTLGADYIVSPRLAAVRDAGRRASVASRQCWKSADGGGSSATTG